MKFNTVAHFFERIEQESSRLIITELLAGLFAKASADEAQILCYLSLGSLRPSYLGSQFNIADKSVEKVLATLLSMDVKDIKTNVKEAGDLGRVLLLKSNPSQPHKQSHELTLIQVYKDLCALSETSGSGSQEDKAAQLLTLLENIDPLSGQYIIRIILGKLRLGFSDMTIIDALSWMLEGNKSLHDRIEHAYNICADLGYIAALLKEQGKEGLDNVSIILGVPIRPAAAERLPTADAIIEKLGPCVAQPKLDGFRLQIHVDNRNKTNKKWFFSRNLIDMSDMFPDLVEALNTLKVDTLIAEGEAIVYNEQTGEFAPFQETVKRKRKHGIEEAAEEFPIKLFLFDILYLNGESLLNKAHTTRREILVSLFPVNHTNIISALDEKHVNNAHDLENYFLENIEQGLEGLVVKKPNSHYQPGKRNFNWIKFKRVETGELDDTMDCVIIGYYAGEGKRASFGIGAFLVAIYNKKQDRFETIAKIGTGLKDQEWIDLKKQCEAIKIKEQPHNVLCAKELMPDVWVNPELVGMIRADEITKSPLHAAGKTDNELGFALRFPRFMGFRPDKAANQATTLDEVQALFNIQKQRPKSS